MSILKEKLKLQCTVHVKCRDRTITTHNCRSVFPQNLVMNRDKCYILDKA